MIVNDKNDILSDILRSFHSDIPARCQESNNLNELAIQHPGKGVKQASTFKRAILQKCQNLLAWRKREKLPDI